MTNYRPSPGCIVSSTPKKYIQMCQLSGPIFPLKLEKRNNTFFFSKPYHLQLHFYHQSPTTNFPTYFSSRSPYKQTGIKHTISQNLKEEKTEEQNFVMVSMSVHVLLKTMKTLSFCSFLSETVQRKKMPNLPAS